jgi:hypothetical protein
MYSPPPDPKSEKGRPRQDGPVSQGDFNAAECKSETSQLQAHKLRRLFCFCHATACTIASLAFAGGVR